MGIHFNTNTWRAPLQLIDCWLPVERAPVTEKILALPKGLQKFARAGWLKRPMAQPMNTVAVAPAAARRCASAVNLDARRRMAPHQPTPMKSGGWPEGRLVLSGRMGDVCAELDRLAAMELMTSR